MGNNDQQILEIFHAAALENDLKYFIIGGIAASYWGTPRFTADIDYVIESSSFERAQQVLESLGYLLRFHHPRGAFAHFEAESRANFRIDLMIVNSDTWNKLAQQSQTANFGGSKDFPIVSPLHLIAMKLHSASQNDRKEWLKDLNDVVEIMRRQSITMTDLSEGGIVARHCSSKIIEELKKLV